MNKKNIHARIDGKRSTENDKQNTLQDNEFQSRMMFFGTNCDI